MQMMVLHYQGFQSEPRMSVISPLGKYGTTRRSGRATPAYIKLSVARPPPTLHHAPSQRAPYAFRSNFKNRNLNYPHKLTS